MVHTLVAQGPKATYLVGAMVEGKYCREATMIIKHDKQL